MLRSEFIMSPHPFFAGLCEYHLRILSECAHRAHFRRGEYIFREGELANRFYLVQHGQVAIESACGDGPVVVQTLLDGDVLGWSWLFPPYQWHFDARAVTDTDAIFLPGVRLRELCECDHAFGAEVMPRITRVVIQRLQAARLKIVADQSTRRDREAGSTIP